MFYTPPGRVARVVFLQTLLKTRLRPPRERLETGATEDGFIVMRCTMNEAIFGDHPVKRMFLKREKDDVTGAYDSSAKQVHELFWHVLSVYLHSKSRRS